MRDIIIDDNNDLTPLTEEGIFNASDLVARQNFITAQNILKSDINTQAKIAKIMSMKRRGNSVLTDIDVNNILKGSFTFDG